MYRVKQFADNQAENGFVWRLQKRGWFFIWYTVTTGYGRKWADSQARLYNCKVIPLEAAW